MVRRLEEVKKARADKTQLAVSPAVLLDGEFKIVPATREPVKFNAKLNPLSQQLSKYGNRNIKDKAVKSINFVKQKMALYSALDQNSARDYEAPQASIRPKTAFS